VPATAISSPWRWGRRWPAPAAAPGGSPSRTDTSAASASRCRPAATSPPCTGTRRRWGSCAASTSCSRGRQRRRRSTCRAPRAPATPAPSIAPSRSAGHSYDVGGDRFSLAVATYMPYAERTTYEAPAGGGPLPTRYHRISADLRNLALVPALSVRFAGDFRLGFAPGFLFSAGRIAFDEPVCPAGDTACPADEDPSHDARYDLGSGF